MKKVNLNESSIPATTSQTLRGYQCALDPIHIPKVYNVIGLAMAEMLKLKKTKEHKTAVAIYDLKTNKLIIAAIANYNKSEDENDDEIIPSNWSLTFTFDEEDLKDANVFKSTDPDFDRILEYISVKSYGFKFTTDLARGVTVEELSKAIKGWLDVNASLEEEVELVLEGIFTASVKVVNDTKLFRIDMAEELKAKIKGETDQDQQA